MSAQKTRLYHRLQIAAHRMQKAADRALIAAGGITTAQAAVLVIVAAQQPSAQRPIAQQLGLNESAMTAMMTRLERMKLLARTPHTGDARTWQVRLTAKGRTALARVRTPFDQINATIDAALSGADLTRLADELARLAAAFVAPA